MTFAMLFPERPKSTGSDPGKRQAYQLRIRTAAQQAYTNAMFEGELYARIIWFYRNESEGDVDNIVKPILDALKGIVYADDGLVVKCVSEKCAKQVADIVNERISPTLYQHLLISLSDDTILHFIYIEVGAIPRRQIVFGMIDGELHND